MTPQHLLLIRTSAFGDVVQTFYVLSDLRRALPHTRIDWCVDERFAELARLHPAVTEIISLPTRRWKHLFTSPGRWLEVIRWIRDLKKKDIDVSLDLQGLYKSALVGWLSRAQLRLGPEAFAESERGVHRLYHREVKGSKVEGLAMRARYLAGAALGYDALSYSIDSGIQNWRPPTGRPQILMMVGASRPEKMWPAEQWVALCKRVLNKAAHSSENDPKIELLWGSEAERQIAITISEKTADSRVVVAPQTYAVAELRSKFLSAQALVGGDTGLAHFAVALGTPTVMLFLKTHAVRYAHPDLKHQFAVDVVDGPVTADRVATELMRARSLGGSLS
ncbi:MAG: lipopolysaccharide heptosyltransferase I [Burkholderiaceae bacterium]|nr:lipopolysaccharide heptosyltransferase I [Burkholderiaceae bacterium]